MLIDAVIVLVVAAALVVGYQKGLLEPLLAEVLFFGALLYIVRHRTGYSSFVSAHLPGGAVAAVFLALVIAVVAGYAGGMLGRTLHRLPVLRGVDGFFGIFVHGAIAVAVLYLGVSALVSLDLAFGPVSNAVELTARQVSQMQTALETTPFLGRAVDPKEYQRLEQEAKKGGARLDTTSQLHTMQQVDATVSSQLRSSRLAKWVLAVGVHLPVVGGHLGPSAILRLRG